MQVSCASVQHMSAMDARAQKAADVEQDLARVTAFQQFDQAAQLKKQLDELSSVDTVGNLMKVKHNDAKLLHTDNDPFFPDTGKVRQRKLSGCAL